MTHIYKCECGKYSLQEDCECGKKAVQPRPPKYSLADKYGNYRREIKREELRLKELY